MSEFVQVGKVVKPHGVRGEVKVRLHWSESSALDACERVWLGEEGSLREFAVSSLRATSKLAIVGLDGIGNMDAAEALRGLPVWVSRAELPELEAGEYFLSDLVGAVVVGPDGEIGEVVEVRVNPSVDSLVIRRPDGSMAEQVLADPWLVEVDVAARRVVLSSTGGLL